MYLTLLQVYGGVYPADKHWYRCRVKELVGDDQVLLSSLICYNTVQLRYIRTTHTRIIRSYFAYTRMSIRVCQYARTCICPFVMHSHEFLYMKHCWSNKGHMGMKSLQSEICILLKRHADQ